MMALRKHCQEPWILLYVERWLSVDAKRGWAASGARQGHAARRRDYALNAKDNFRFERTIIGWRGRVLLDLRHKR
jgi:hypothetical protein